MRKFDYHWMDNENWFHQLENGVFVINDDAPLEAHESYKHYLEQSEQAERNVEANETLD